MTETVVEEVDRDCQGEEWCCGRQGCWNDGRCCHRCSLGHAAVSGSERKEMHSRLC